MANHAYNRNPNLGTQILTAQAKWEQQAKPVYVA